ncbi:MAG TPA: glycosyltransferase [Rhodospirillales bacterium]|nr:glycosyltransferase [Rhodospirillales bacterium]
MPAATPSRTALELERQERLIRRLRRRLAEGQGNEGGQAIPALPLAPFRRSRYEPVPGPAPATEAVAGADDRELVKALTVAPGALCRSLAGAPLPVIAISVCGLPTIRLETELAEIEEQQTVSRNFLPLLLTDDPEHLPAIRKRGWTAELLPREEELDACPGAFPVRSLLRSRLRLLAAQWRVVRFVDRGRRPLPLPETVVPRPAAVRLLYFKDYGRYNPYQRLLYAAMPGIAAEPGDIDAALALRAAMPPDLPVVFHLHWEEAVYAAAASAGDAERLRQAFLERLDAFLAAGGQLVWTVHNLVPHENRFPAVHGRLVEGLVARAGLVHVHNRFSARRMRARGVTGDRLLLLPHGNYDGLWTTVPDPDEARATLGLPGRTTLFGLVGAIRTYKGAPALLSAFAELPRNVARLLLAGRQFPPLAIERLPAAVREEILAVDRFLGEDEVALAVRACDFLVLPYRRTTTSGAVLLAFSLGVPVIAPDLPAFAELVEDGGNGILYPRRRRDGLRDALLAALATSPAERRTLGAAARDTARRYDHGWIGRRLAAAIRELARPATVPEAFSAPSA